MQLFRGRTLWTQLPNEGKLQGKSLTGACASSRDGAVCLHYHGLCAARSLDIARAPTIAVALPSEEPVLRSRFRMKIVVENATDREEALCEVLQRIAPTGKADLQP